MAAGCWFLAIWMFEKAGYQVAFNGTTFAASICLVFSLGGALIAIVSIRQLLLGLPELQLSDDGIVFRDGLRTRTYKWDDVGPFAAHHFSSKGTTVYSLLALSKVSHDAVTGGADEPEVSLSTSEISIDVSLLRHARPIEKTWDLADEINVWRRRYGLPKKDARARSNQEDEVIRRALKVKSLKRRFWFVGSLGLFIALAILAKLNS